MVIDRLNKNVRSALPEHPSRDKRFKMLDATIKRHQYQQDALIEILHKAQELFGYFDGTVHGNQTPELVGEQVSKYLGKQE